MRKGLIILASLLLALSVTACGGATESSGENGSDNNSAEGSNDGPVGGSSVREKVRLNDDYGNALSVQAQLAVGTLQLEDTDLMVDEALATQLLPLWEALRSLSNSDTAAEAEIRAVINQIQDTMKAEQIEAIADMQLTEESLTTLQEDGLLAIGRGFGGRANEDGEGASLPQGGFGGGFPGGGPGGGGVPGGGFPGGGPGGGFGGGVGELSEDDIATRRAQFAEGDFSAFQDQALLGAVVRLLQVKTGQALELEGRGIVGIVFEIVSQQTGLSVEEVQAQMTGDATLAEIVEANGGDVEAVRDALIEALDTLPNAADIDAETLADQWLGTN